MVAKSLFRMADIYRNKIAVITGGASGLGAALGRELVARGATVIIGDIDRRKAEEVAMALGRSAHAIATDVTKAEQIDALTKQVKSEFGALDLFFNSAGISSYGEAYELPFTEWDRVLRVNLAGVVYGSLCAYRIMKEQGSGKIVNMGSGSFYTCDPLFGPYVTSKYGVVGFTRTLAIEAEAYNIGVSVVCPGIIRTPMLAGKEPSRLTAPVPVETAVQRILRGVERNQRFIVFPFRWRVMWWADRLSPALLNPFRRALIRARRRKSTD